MTLVQFTYSAGYHRPAVGGVVFMPHRKHAANETTVLPRPFTRPLVNGVVEVDLEPTGDDWLWSVTHDHNTRFYAIPEADGVVDHADLIPVAPSTLTHRIEPVWWAELRQLQNLITGYIDETQSNVREAIDTVNTVHNTLETAVSDAQRHESVSGAYSRQSQLSAQDAWEASKGPDGAAQRAKNEADRARTYRDETRDNVTTSQQHADRAANEHQYAATQADRARDEADRAEGVADDWQELQDAVDASQAEADRSKNEADRSSSEADRSTTQANIATTQADYSHDSAVQAGDEADTATVQADRATTEADRSRDEADRAEGIADSWESLQVAVNETATSASAASTSATNAAQSESNAAKSESNASDHVATVENLIDTFAILESPNGTQYHITVDDAGALSTTVVA